MKILKTSVFILALLLLIRPACAQMGMGKIEEIEAVKGRKLIVMIEEPNEKMIKKITKKPKLGTVDEYKADLKLFNENFKQVVERFWPYNKKDILYKTFDEINAIHKTKTKEYAVLACHSAQPTKFTSSGGGFIFNPGLTWSKNVKEDFEDRDNDIFTVMMIETIEDVGGSIVPVYFTPLYDIFPSKAALVHGVKSIDKYFNMRIETKKNGMKAKEVMAAEKRKIEVKAPKVADKILLIRSEWLDDELNEANLKNFYPYKYKVCDRAFMDDVVMNQDSKYVYGVVLPVTYSGSTVNSVSYSQFVIDPVDNETMSYVASKSSMFGGKSKTINFTGKTLTTIVEQIKGKPIEL